MITTEVAGGSGSVTSDTKERVVRAIRKVLARYRMWASDEDWLSGGPLVLDSLEGMELRVSLEREFAIVIEDWELVDRKLDTLDDVVAFIVGKVAAAALDGEGSPRGGVG